MRLDLKIFLLLTIPFIFGFNGAFFSSTGSVIHQEGGGGGCSGVDMFGTCWHLSNFNESCFEACSFGGRNGVFPGIDGIVGQTGTDLNCNNVLNALGGLGSVTNASSSGGANYGCTTNNVGNRKRFTALPFSDTAKQSSLQIACACHN